MHVLFPSGGWTDIRLRWGAWAAAALLLLAGCQRIADLPFVDLERPAEAAAPAAPPGGEPLRIAVAPVITPRENLNAFEPLLRYLGDRLGRPVQYVRTQTYTEINEMMKFGSVDVALVCSYPYILGQAEGYMELLAIPEIEGKVRYSSYVIVPADSPARRLEDLRGKTFAFSDPLSFSGRLAPTYMLWRLGATPEGFFGRTIFTYSHANSVRAVVRHLADGAAVDSAVYDYLLRQHPEYRDQLRLIASSPETGMLPLVVRADLDPELKARLRRVFLTAHQDEEGRRALAALQVDRFRPADDAAYDVIRTMLREMGAWR